MAQLERLQLEDCSVIHGVNTVHELASEAYPEYLARSGSFAGASASPYIIVFFRGSLPLSSAAEQ